MLKHLKILTELILVISFLFIGIQSTLAVGDSPVWGMNTTAGKPALVLLKGDPGSVVSLGIKTPYNAVIEQNFRLNENGVLQYWFSQTKRAGVYQVLHEGNAYPFEVQSAKADSNKSDFSLSDYTAYIGSDIEVSAVIVDAYGNRKKQYQIFPETNNRSKVICSDRCKTDDNGNISFRIRSNTTGLKHLTVRDAEKRRILFEEDLGFIPKVQSSVYSDFKSGYRSSVGDAQTEQYIPYIYQSGIEQNFDGIKVIDPLKAQYNSRGNNDFGTTGGFNYQPEDFSGANLISEAQALLDQLDKSSEASESVNGNSTLAQATGNISGFEIIIGTDPEKEYEEEDSVIAQTAIDFIIRAVDDSGEVVEDYTGEVEFSIDPAGPLMPTDYTFSPLDKGTAIFELALVLPVNEYVFSVSDVADESISGDITLVSEPAGSQDLNNTNIILSLESPIVNSVYSGTLVVKGATSTDNTMIIVTEGDSELKRVEVDEDKTFNIPLTLSDGKHDILVTARYLVDGSEVETPLAISIDNTAPLIIQVYSDLEPVRAGEVFTMRVEAEEDAILKAIINNRAYEFEGDGTDYTLKAKAPLDIGDYQISLKISDEFGNSDTTSDVAVLTVLEKLEDIKNLFGIPGSRSMTLSWDPVEGAAIYEVSYKSILGSLIKSKSTADARITMQDLRPDISYVFTVTAKDSIGEDLSLPTKSRALRPLDGAVVGEPTVGGTLLEKNIPNRQPKSGPEVYLLIFLSIIVMNLYGRVRRAFTVSE